MKLSFWDILASMVMLGGLALATIFINIFINPYSFINPFPPPTPVASLQVPTLTPSQRSLPELWTATPETPGVPSVTSASSSQTITVTTTHLVLPTGTATRTRTPLPSATKSPSKTPNRTWTAIAYKTGTATSSSSSDTTKPTNPGVPYLNGSNSSDSTPTWAWTASSDSGSGIDYYQITWGPATGCENPVKTSETNGWTAPEMTANTTSYICVRAVDGEGNQSAWVGDVGFYYSNIAAPSVTTTSATAITNSTATLNGTVNPNSASTTAVAFQYGLTASYGTTVFLPGYLSGSTTQNVSLAINGLASGATYHFRVAASNEYGAAGYGGDVTFTTSSGLGQTITFTSSAPAGAIFGVGSYTPTATASSGLAVTFTSATPSICTISGGVVSFAGAGTCTINANQAGNGTYAPAPQVQQSFVIAQASQTIAYTSVAPGAAVVGGTTYTVSATGGASGNAVVFTSGSSSICTIATNVVSFVGAGSCVINANQTGNANYAAAPQLQQIFAVGQGPQTIIFTSTAPVGAIVGGTSYPVTATGGASGNAVTFTIDGAASSVCSIAGSTVSFTGVGTCIIDANQLGNANYTAAPQAQQSFAVGQGSQTIIFTSTAPGGATFGGTTYAVTATGGASGNAVTFTIDAAASSVCSIAGSTVTFIGVGNCIIDANQAGNVNYTAAAQVQQTFAVAKANQTISFTGPGAGTVLGTYTPAGTATSSLTVSFSIDGSSSTVCHIATGIVTYDTIGSCIINADQAGDANYNPAPTVPQIVTVS